MFYRNFLQSNKNYRKYFPAKIYNIFSNLNSLHKNTVLRNRVCSITTCLFRSETKRYTMKYRRTPQYCLKNNVHFYCMYSIKIKILSTLGTGYFLKIVKLIPSLKNQSALIAKISSRKQKKSLICKNKLPQKFRATRY